MVSGLMEVLDTRGAPVKPRPELDMSFSRSWANCRQSARYCDPDHQVESEFTNESDYFQIDGHSPRASLGVASCSLLRWFLMASLAALSPSSAS